MINSIKIKVRGYHLDVFQHVNNARYLEFLEEGRWAFFDEFDAQLAKPMASGLAWAVVNININFRSEGNFADTLEIQTAFAKLGNRSITMKQKVINAHTKALVADAEVTYVCFSKELKAAIPLPDDYKSKIAAAITPLD